MSEAKEGKLFERKKLLDPLLGTTEGTKITSTIIFYTSHALTVYSTVHLQILKLWWKVIFLPPLKRQNFRNASRLDCYPHLISCLRKAKFKCRHRFVAVLLKMRKKISRKPG